MANGRPTTQRRGPDGRQRLLRYIGEKRGAQSALADALQISRSHLSEILTGRKSPSLALASKIEQVTGIPARAFAVKVAA